MKLFFRSVLILCCSLSLSAMMLSGAGGRRLDSLPWRVSPFDARYTATETSRKNPKMWIVFDMDETLLWQRSLQLQKPIYRYGILELLAYLRSIDSVEMILWTAAERDFVDRDIKPFFHRIITRSDGNWFEVCGGSKPLRILPDVDPDRVVMFDDRSHSIQEDRHRALLVHGFHGPSGMEHEPQIDPNDLTHENIKWLVEYLLSQIHLGKTVPRALMELTSRTQFLEWYQCHQLVQQFMRVPKTPLDENHTAIPFVVDVVSDED